jgi:hypothetical protein
MANSTIVSNAANLKKYLDLPQKGAVMAEYVWIDGSNGIRSKSKVSILQLSDPSTRSLAASTAALTPTLRPQISPSLRLEIF